MEYLGRDILTPAPLNYQGSKFKLLPYLLPLFPDKVNTFVDLFCGGLAVSVNIQSNIVIANDINYRLTDLYTYLKVTSIEHIILEIETIIEDFNLSKTNSEGFYTLKDFYNKNINDLSPIYLLVLIFYSYTFIVKFNREGLFTTAKGDKDFNQYKKSILIAFLKKLQSINISFLSCDFSDFDFDSLDKDDFIYIDSPYLLTAAGYNKPNVFDKNGWTIEKQKDLFKVIHKIHDKGLRFGLSDVLIHRGVEHSLLKEFIQDFKMIRLDKNYSNSNLSRLDKSISQEIYVYNY